jgi:hypothetical protein
MKAKKALKKLYKKSKQHSVSHSMDQLKSLKKPLSSQQSATPNTDSNPLLDDFKDLAGQVALSAAQELAQPLNPILSWFNDGGGYVDLAPVQRKANKLDVRQANLIATSAQPANQPQLRSIGTLPLKSPPCKRCPALANGICKCAAKKFKMSA